MSSKEKADNLIIKYTKERCLQVADQMVCHHIGIGVDELVTFWEQVWGHIYTLEEDSPE